MKAAVLNAFGEPLAIHGDALPEEGVADEAGEPNTAPTLTA